MNEITIQIERHIDKHRLESLGVANWPTWSKECSTFPWHYELAETSYIVHGEVLVTPQDGEPVLLRAGDLVTFPAGLSCRWEIRADLLKHYRF